MIVANESTIEAVAALSDLGKYVAVDVQSMNTVTETAAADDDDDDDDGSGVRLYQSIYETALRNKVPASVIEDMVRIYSYDVDFQRKVQPGDSFDVFFAGDDEGTTTTEKTEVLFASLTVGGETKKYYRFQTPDDAVVDFYDETGKSAKKFLVRKPVNNAIMRSGFGGRRHPILGYVKMHTGVDWATPYGTPIFASGNGVVEKVGWEGGYGKYVRLKHNNGYETAYGHMSAYAKGMEPGKRVRQGQVIGFVGSTGMSTGAHVHYEILVNGRFVDPMRIKLPRGRSLDGALLASFEKERERLDAQMSNRGAARVSDAAVGIDAGAAGQQPLRPGLDRDTPINWFVASSIAGPLPIGGEDQAKTTSVQLPLRDRRVELRDLGGLRRLAVEGQHVAFGRDRNAIAVGDLAGQDHLRQRILHVSLDHPLQGTRAIGGIPALGGEPVARRGIEREHDLAFLQQPGAAG